MDTQFWLERWESCQTGFHQQQVNSYLQRYWSTLGLEAGSRVMVPLCGKSLDMLWLEAQGYRVIGIELSRVAAESFFTENGLTPEVHTEQNCIRYTHGNTELLCGNFFKLTTKDTGKIDAFYDRAALIALTAEQRPAYANRLAQLTGSSTPGLLITLDYKQSEMHGPPFAVPEEEVALLFTSRFAIEHIDQRDVLDDNARFTERGISSLVEHSYRLNRT